MMSFLAQLLVISGQEKKEEDKVVEPCYRPYCPECNDEGRDARHPCPGHQ